MLQVLKELLQAPGNTLTGLLWTERFGFISTPQSSQSRFECRLDFRCSLVSGNNSLLHWILQEDTKILFLFLFLFFQHHCRNCGGIFCNSCSDYTMPLPSSAKPVRVCDACYTTLLQRYQRWQQSAMHLVSGCLDLYACCDVEIFGESFLEKNFTTYFRLGKIFNFLVQARFYASLKFIVFFFNKTLWD